MLVRAQLKYLRMSPRKVRLVAGLLRGRTVPEARLRLAAVVRGAATPLRKLLKSAVANAKHSFALDESRLYIAGIRVDGGPTLKRFRPRSRGMTHPIHKRTSHITILLDERGEAVRTVAAEAFAPEPEGVSAADSSTKPTERRQRTWRDGAREAGPATRRQRILDVGRRIFRRKAI
ncbi:50S ribosomal protein L22 [Candidatus Parcubacteria bacterium]|nr:50S ribosomal protein L22 [Candidatus Parcubacteria bacterium]